MLLFLSDGYLTGMLLWLIAGAFGFWLLLRLRGMWRGQPRRLNWIHAGLSMWMLLALFTGIELYFALIYDTSDSFNMTNVSQKWFKLHVEPQRRQLPLSNEEKIDYRDDRDFPETVGLDQKHIVFLGDSFTFAQGVAEVKDRFSNRIRSELDRSQPDRYLVSNLAEPGTDLVWGERVLELLYARRQKIDFAVYVLCLNDIESFHKRHMAFYHELDLAKPQFFLFRDTYFPNWMYFRLKQFTATDVRGYYGFVRDYYNGEPWLRMREKLDQVQKMCQTHGTDFRVVVFPFLHNLGPAYPFREVHRQIADHCRVAGIPVLDLEPALTRMSSKSLTVNRFDAHPNELAHRIAAEEILQKLFQDFVANGNLKIDGS